MNKRYISKPECKKLLDLVCTELADSVYEQTPLTKDDFEEEGLLL